MNVLLTCAGRRNYLIQFFREALDPPGKVFAADASADAPALAEADEAFLLPVLGDPTYIDQLLAICQERRVGLLISLNDLELLLLAQHRDRFLAIGVSPVISPPMVVETCFDKWESFLFLKANGIATPRTYLSPATTRAALARGDIAFPLVVKPRWGSGSAGIEYVEDADELDLVYALAAKRYVPALPPGQHPATARHTMLIQEYLGGQEYGLDVVNDLEGRYVGTLVRRKLVMRSGETDRAVTVRDVALERLGETLGRRLGHLGTLDCDVFVQGNTCSVLEMNPRFGGGYPFSHAAGANVPAAMLAWANGQPADPACFAVMPHVTASKCDRVVVMDTSRVVDVEPWRDQRHEETVIAVRKVTRSK